MTRRPSQKKNESRIPREGVTRQGGGEASGQLAALKLPAGENAAISPEASARYPNSRPTAAASAGPAESPAASAAPIPPTDAASPWRERGDREPHTTARRFAADALAWTAAVVGSVLSLTALPVDRMPSSPQAFQPGQVSQVGHAPAETLSASSPYAVRHTVKYGDTVWDVSGKYGVSVDDLVRANPDLVNEPDLIRPGQRLQVPANAPTPLAAHSPQSAVGPSDQPPGGGGAVRIAANDTASRIKQAAMETPRHHVAEGDSLETISRTTLGDPRRWPEIWAKNSGSVQDPNLIFPGQNLALPPTRRQLQIGLVSRELSKLEVATAEFERSSLTSRNWVQRRVDNVSRSFLGVTGSRRENFELTQAQLQRLGQQVLDAPQSGSPGLDGRVSLLLRGFAMQDDVLRHRQAQTAELTDTSLTFGPPAAMAAAATAAVAVTRRRRSSSDDPPIDTSVSASGGPEPKGARSPGAIPAPNDATPESLQRRLNTGRFPQSEPLPASEASGQPAALKLPAGENAAISPEASARYRALIADPEAFTQQTHGLLAAFRDGRVWDGRLKEDLRTTTPVDPDGTPRPLPADAASGRTFYRRVSSSEYNALFAEGYDRLHGEGAFERERARGGFAVLEGIVEPYSMLGRRFIETLPEGQGDGLREIEVNVLPPDRVDFRERHRVEVTRPLNQRGQPQGEKVVEVRAPRLPLLPTVHRVSTAFNTPTDPSHSFTSYVAAGASVDLLPLKPSAFLMATGGPRWDYRQTYYWKDARTWWLTNRTEQPDVLQPVRERGVGLWANGYLNWLRRLEFSTSARVALLPTESPVSASAKHRKTQGKLEFGAMVGPVSEALEPGQPKKRFFVGGILEAGAGAGFSVSNTAPILPENRAYVIGGVISSASGYEEVTKKFFDREDRMEAGLGRGLGSAALYLRTLFGAPQYPPPAQHAPIAATRPLPVERGNPPGFIADLANEPAAAPPTLAWPSAQFPLRPLWTNSTGQSSPSLQPPRDSYSLFDSRARPAPTTEQPALTHDVPRPKALFSPYASLQSAAKSIAERDGTGYFEQSSAGPLSTTIGAQPPPSVQTTAGMVDQFSIGAAAVLSAHPVEHALSTAGRKLNELTRPLTNWLVDIPQNVWERLPEQTRTDLRQAWLGQPETWMPETDFNGLDKRTSAALNNVTVVPDEMWNRLPSDLQQHLSTAARGTLYTVQQDLRQDAMLKQAILEAPMGVGPAIKWTFTGRDGSESLVTKIAKGADRFWTSPPVKLAQGTAKVVGFVAHRGINALMILEAAAGGPKVHLYSPASRQPITEPALEALRIGYVPTNDGTMAMTLQANLVPSASITFWAAGPVMRDGIPRFDRRSGGGVAQSRIISTWQANPAALGVITKIGGVNAHWARGLTLRPAGEIAANPLAIMTSLDTGTSASSADRRPKGDLDAYGYGVTDPSGFIGAFDTMRLGPVAATPLRMVSNLGPGFRLSAGTSGASLVRTPPIDSLAAAVFQTNPAYGWSIPRTPPRHAELSGDGKHLRVTWGAPGTGGSKGAFVSTRNAFQIESSTYVDPATGWMAVLAAARNSTPLWLTPDIANAAKAAAESRSGRFDAAEFQTRPEAVTADQWIQALQTPDGRQRVAREIRRLGQADLASGIRMLSGKVADPIVREMIDGNLGYFLALARDAMDTSR